MSCPKPHLHTPNSTTKPENPKDKITMHYCKTTININMHKKKLDGVENLAALVFSYCSSHFFPYIPTNFLIINMTYVSAQGAQVSLPQSSLDSFSSPPPLCPCHHGDSL